MTTPILKKFVVFQLRKKFWSSIEDDNGFKLEFIKILPFDTREECEPDILIMMKNNRNKNIRLVLQEVYFFADDEILGGI